MGERRKTPRTRTMLGGVIAFNRRRSTMDCTVRNLSQHGARIEFANTAMLPDAFDLTIARHDANFRARMAWRAENAAGIVFIDVQRSTVVPLDLARKLQTLQAENNALRQRIAELSGGAI